MTTTTTMDHLKAKIRHVPDFPKAGILFYDITTLMQEPAGFRAAIDSLATPFEGQGIDLVVGIESRGFIFGAAVADRIGAGFTPVRKPGKLPSTTVRETYALEVGAAFDGGVEPEDTQLSLADWAHCGDHLHR